MAKDMDEKLQRIFAEYAKKLPGKIAEIDHWWRLLQDHWDSQKWRDFHRYIHTLTGTAGTYGYQQLSIAARNLTSFLSKYLEQPPTAKELAEINVLIEELKQIITVCPLTEMKFDTDTKKYVKAETNEKKLIYLLENDMPLSQEIVIQLNYFGYELQTFSDGAEFISELNHIKPDVIIIDIATLTEKDKITLPLSLPLYKGIPTIIISQYNNLKDHLEAVRLGSTAFFVKPLEFTLIVNKLNQIFDVILNPYRILIVDDSSSMAEYYSTILEKAGMQTSVITNPSYINQALITFNPELILMDIYMPNISGLELAAVLRQQAAYASIPIVFLSSEEEKTKQLEAMSIGGDDFITKPISPEYLIWSIKNRVERYRVLKTLMLKDSLTGLYNHTNIQTQLEFELRRAERQNQPLTFIMIDVDNFKDVNDNYGHPVGDQVLKALSLLLQQRLRKTDIIGRYGGEEFALVLPNTSFEESFRICENIRKSFAELRHYTDKQDFTVSFSAGIASRPPYGDATDLIKAADEALYKAKHAGRNRTV